MDQTYHLKACKRSGIYPKQGNWKFSGGKTGAPFARSVIRGNQAIYDQSRFPNIAWATTAADRGWLQVLDELEALTPALVVPGHGEPGNWRQLVEPQREYLDTLLKEIRTYIANGSRLSDALNEVMAENAGQWQLYDLHHPSNITKAFTELEWE